MTTRYKPDGHRDSFGWVRGSCTTDSEGDFVHFSDYEKLEEISRELLLLVIENRMPTTIEGVDRAFRRPEIIRNAKKLLGEEP